MILFPYQDKIGGNIFQKNVRKQKSKPPHGVATKETLQDLSPLLKKQLYKLYEVDFKAFGFNPEEEDF